MHCFPNALIHTNKPKALKSSFHLCTLVAKRADLLPKHEVCCSSYLSKKSFLVDISSNLDHRRYFGQVKHSTDYGKQWQEGGKRYFADKTITQHESSTAVEFEIGQSQRELKILHSEGKYYEALELARNIQIKIKDHFGKKHPVHASALNNIALMQKLLGHFDDAIESYTQAVQIYEEIAGKEHASYVTALCNLGLAFKSMADSASGLERMGLLERAHEALEDVLEVRRKKLESTSPDLALAMSHLGTVQFQLGKHETAEDLLTEALKILEENHDPESLTLALAQNNLAVFLKASERYEEAKPLYQRARHIRLAKLGVKHPDTIVSTSNLAELYRAIGDEESAEVLQREIIESMS